MPKEWHLMTDKGLPTSPSINRETGEIPKYFSTAVNNFSLYYYKEGQGGGGILPRILNTLMYLSEHPLLLYHK